MAPEKKPDTAEPGKTPPKSSSFPKWEYRVERYHPDDAPASAGQAGQDDYRLQSVYQGSGLAGFHLLGTLGAEGWELVSATYNMPYEMTYEFIFKRPLIDEKKADEKVDED